MIFLLAIAAWAVVSGGVALAAWVASRWERPDPVTEAEQILKRWGRWPTD